MASSKSVAVTGMGEPQSLLDMQLWYSCAGVLVKIPPVNSQVYYFVQGHAEHASAAGSSVNLEMIKTISHRILCRVQKVEYWTDKDTNEVYTKILLKPVDEPIENVDVPEYNGACKYASKKLTATDIFTKRFHATRGCAGVIFPGDHDVSHDTDIDATDILGKTWNFSGRSDRLIGGWSEFMKAKDLTEGDTILFMRDTGGNLRVGIRRANPIVQRNVNAISVVVAATLAATSASYLNPFEVFYYPHLGTPEFVVQAARVEAAIRGLCKRDLGFTVEVEDERNLATTRSVSGRILSVEAVDPANWPLSPWKCLQVTTQDGRVSPWTVTIQVPSNYNPSGSGSGSGSGSKPTTMQLFDLNSEPNV